MNKSKIKIMKYYIETTQDIIEEYGVEGISIRKIAEKTGYNSATLYNYFENLEVLILYASVSHLSDYIFELNEKTKSLKDPKQKYLKVYEVFNKYAFSNPEIYFNMFYGSYAKFLPDIISKYYKLFPENLCDISDEDIYNMLTEGNIFNRDLKVTHGFLKNNILDEKKLKFLIETTVRVHMSYMYDIIYKEDIDKEFYSKKFLSFINYLIDVLIKGEV